MAKSPITALNINSQGLPPIFTMGVLRIVKLMSTTPIKFLKKQFQ
jgi:hypothetical protein